jgi:alpha-beta hydrolase superfamily lysophospholipase
VHICHGDADEIVPFADARALASHLKCPHKLHVLEGATHSLDTAPEVETVRRVVGGIWESTQGA